MSNIVLRPELEEASLRSEADPLIFFVEAVFREVVRRSSTVDAAVNFQSRLDFDWSKQPPKRVWEEKTRMVRHSSIKELARAQNERAR